MEFDFESLPPPARYELLMSTIAPRPIALITTRSAEGIVNAAPFSQFTVLGHNPAILAVAIAAHPEGRMKDTSRNVLATGELVVNMVGEDIAEAMSLTCIDAPADVSEIEVAGLDITPSLEVAPPRIASSPVCLECRLVTTMSFNPHQAIVLARVVHAHVADRFVIDAARGVIDTPALKLVGVMHAARWYARTSDLFAIERPLPWGQRKA